MQRVNNANEELQTQIEREKEVEREGLIDAMANISGLTQQACRNYVKALTNPHNADYEEFPRDEKKYIRKRDK